MKNLYVLTLLLVMSVLLNGQNYLTEDFSSSQMPPSGWTIDGLPAQWSISNANTAGGVAPEGMFSYINQTTTSRLVSPEIDLTGLTSVSISFRHFYDDYAGAGPAIGLATRSSGGSWNQVWQVSPTGNLGPEDKTIEVTNNDVGNPDFQFCLYLNGNMYNVDYWYLDDIKVFTPYELDAELTFVDLPQYVQYGTEIDLTGAVKNMGSNNITSFDVSYTVDGGTPAVSSVTGINIPFGGFYDFVHDTPVLLPVAGTYEIIVTVENVNGGTDNDPSNNTLTKFVGAVPFIPSKKVIGEEATGTWCGWCVRGICFMDYMAETYPETWIGVAVHNGDPMVVPAYDNAIPSIIPNFPGYPSGAIDRAGDNYWDPSDFETGYLQRLEAISPATIDIVNFNWDPVTRIVNFELRSEFVVDINHELRFCAIMTEDSCWGTTAQWNQTNYYAGGANGPMCGFESLPGTIPASQMHYDHVARAILDTPYGTPGSLPTTIAGGDILSYFYTYTLPDTWVYEKMHFIGALIDMSTGEILNSNNVINYSTGINELGSDAEVSLFPNPSSGRFFLRGVEKADVSIYSVSGNLIFSAIDISSQGIDLSGYDNGFYYVRIQIPGKPVINRKISLIR
ncbi:MAG: T9SS type A sorting domain-containing protein [Bacteroidetes bacterium]|nr:T9SS type A sorting domain-containing protein [Bacteroidota bacterium]